MVRIGRRTLINKKKNSEMDRSAVLKGFWGCVKIKSSAMHDHLLLLEKGW